MIPGVVTELVASYLDHLAVERGTARNTLDSYTRDLRRYTEHLESAGITELVATVCGDNPRVVSSLRGVAESLHVTWQGREREFVVGLGR